MFNLFVNKNKNLNFSSIHNILNTVLIEQLIDFLNKLVADCFGDHRNLMQVLWKVADGDSENLSNDMAEILP